MLKEERDEILIKKMTEAGEMCLRARTSDLFIMKQAIERELDRRLE